MQLRELRRAPTVTLALRDRLAAGECRATFDISYITAGGDYDEGDDIWLDNLRANVVPEPGTMTLLALGGLGILARRRRKA